jgi:hypothetical protein
MIKKKLLAEKIGEKMAILTQITGIYIGRKNNHTMLRKTSIFWQNKQKFTKIVS